MKLRTRKLIKDAEGEDICDKERETNSQDGEKKDTDSADYGRTE